MTTFYALQYAHGIDYLASAQVYAFPSRDARDAFVQAGHGIATNAGFRDAVGASHRKVRAAKRQQARGNFEAILTRELSPGFVDAEGCEWPAQWVTSPY